MIGFPTPESPVSIGGLAVAELALDNALSGRMEGMHILRAGFLAFRSGFQLINLGNLAVEGPICCCWV